MTEATSAVSVALTRQMLWRFAGAPAPFELLTSTSRCRSSAAATPMCAKASRPSSKSGPVISRKVSQDMPSQYPWWHDQNSRNVTPANFHTISKAIRMRDQFSNTQAIRKPAVTSKGGIVAAQSSKAAQVGAEVLAAGGDCVDAVIATTFALGVLEPWMSGLGGGGAMVLYRAREDRYEVIDYGMRAPASLRLEDYPLTGGGAASDIFPWPRVKDDRNLHGPGSIAVPGVVAGMEEAHRRHAKLPWKELLAPSVKLAGEGLAVDWWTTLMISSAAADLRRYPASAAAYLLDGLPPNRAMGHQVRGPHAAGPAQGHDGAARQRRPARLLRGRSGEQPRRRHPGRRRRAVGRRPQAVPRSSA